MTLWIDEGTEALIGREAFDTLKSRLSALEGIDDVVHEDRETLAVG